MLLASLFLAAAAQAQQFYDNGNCYLLYYTNIYRLSAYSSMVTGGCVITGFSCKFIDDHYVYPSSITIPDSIDGVPITVIDDGAFVRSQYDYGSVSGKDLKSISLPYSIRCIGSGAFSNCCNMVMYGAPSVCWIGDSAFENCTNLEDVYFSISSLNNLYYIGWSAFAGCSKLRHIPGLFIDNALIINSISGRPGCQFYGCSSLKGNLFQDGLTINCDKLGPGAFSGCTSLTSVTNTGGTVPDHMFSGCTSLASWTSHDNVRVGFQAFSNCTSLTQMTISGADCYGIFILDQAFYGCSSLTNVTIAGDAPPYSESPGPFDGTPATIYYYYGTSGWGPTYAGHPTVMLGGPTATLTGQVTGIYDGSPVAGATVQIGSYSGTTDGNGKYSISSIPFGSYTATVSKANYETLTTSVDLGQATVTQNFSLTPDAALALLVVRAEPAEGGMVIGGGSFPIDSWQQISAGPSPGWRFVMWEENFSPAMTQRVQVPKEGATYTAKFEPIQDSELSPELNPVVIQGHSLILSWPTLTLPGVRVVYQVERRADLNSGDWEVVAPNLEATELNNISVTLPISGMQGYFRVGAIRIVAP